MFNRKMLLFVSAFSFWALGARADVACVKQDCATLGYTKTLAQCSGADNIIKCPFDTSKVACNTPVTISTPIFDILYNWASGNYCLDPIERSLDGDVGQCFTNHMSTKDELCSKWAGLGLGLDRYNCMMSADVDIASINTMQDLVSAVESVLLNPCAGATEYDPEWQTCSNICKNSASASNKHFCFSTPEAISCLTAIREAGGIALESNTVISSGNTYFVLGGSNLGELNGIDSVTFAPATQLAACAHDPSIMNRDNTLIVEDLFIDGSKSEISFYVPVVINNLAYITYPSIPVTLNFYAYSEIKNAEVIGHSHLQINAMDSVKVRANFSSCTAGPCYVDFRGIAGSANAMLEYCTSSASVDCHDQTCTETCPIYFH